MSDVSILFLIMFLWLCTEPRTHESLVVPDECEEDEKGHLHCSEEEEEEEAEGESEPHWNGPGQTLYLFHLQECLTNA